MFKNKIGIIALILLLFLSLSIVQASELCENSIDYSSQYQDINSIDYSSQYQDINSIDSSSQALDTNTIEENQLSDNDLIENPDNDCQILDDDLSDCSQDENNLNELEIIANPNINENPTNSVNSKITTKLSANKVNTYYKEKSSLVIYLKDSNNKAIRKKPVKIFLNGKRYSRITDTFGKIALKLNLKPNRYNVKISFDGDNRHKASSIRTVINVKKAPLSIETANAKSYHHPDTFFKAKVINRITKSPVEGIRVSFKVCSSRNKYKIYYAFTDKNGMATIRNHLKTGFYHVYTYINDNRQRPFISYKNSKKRVTLQVMDTREMGCSSIYAYLNENESALSFRRDSTYAANLYIAAQWWYGRYAIKQYKLAGTYFFHAIVTSDGWLIGTGGVDNPTVNKRIESLAGKIVSSNSLNPSILRSIWNQERKLSTGHFAIVAPNGRYAVVWRSGYIRGRLNSGEYLDVPNARSLFRYGSYKRFSNNTAKAALRIAATDVFGINRRNIMTYHYKRVTKNYKTSSKVNVYGANDRGNLVGRYTVGKSDNIYFKNQFISKSKLYGTPYQKFIGVHQFGNIDKYFKAQTRVYCPNITRRFNQTTFLKLSLRNNKTNVLLKGVKVNLKVFSGNTYKNYIVVTDNYGIAQLSTKAFSVGTHRVLISPANHNYIISGEARLVIIR